MAHEEQDHQRHGVGPFFGAFYSKRPAHNRKTWNIILGKENVT
jgi:hypothetical protein